jgi:DNA replication protein DnaC
MKDFIPCTICEDGYIYLASGVKKCDCLREYQRNIILESRLNKSGIPLYMKDYSITQYIGSNSIENIHKLKKYVNKFKEKYHNISLYLWSYINSTQKTTVAQWLGKELLEKNISVGFTSMNSLVVLLQDAYYNKEGEKERVADLLSKDFLILDESFDKEKVIIWGEKYQKNFLDNFLRTRLETFQKPICFTSNISVNDVSEIWGNHIQALLTRHVPDVMEFKDVSDQSLVYNIMNLWED